MSKRNIYITVAAVLAIAVAIFMFVFVGQAPTERDAEGLSTELEDASDPTMEAGPEDPPPPETTAQPPAQ